MELRLCFARPQPRLTTLLFRRGGPLPGFSRPGGGPGAGWGGGRRESEPRLPAVLAGAAPEGLLGRGGGAVRVRLLGGRHAARQAHLPAVRRALHSDMVRHQLELFILSAVLRRARLHSGGEAVREAEIPVGARGPARPGAARLGAAG